MTVLHHHGPHARRTPRLRAPVAAFLVGFLVALPLAAYVGTVVLPSLLPLRDRVLPPDAANVVTLVMALATGLAAAICATARSASKLAHAKPPAPRRSPAHPRSRRVRESGG